MKIYRLKCGIYVGMLRKNVGTERRAIATGYSFGEVIARLLEVKK